MLKLLFITEIFGGKMSLLESIDKPSPPHLWPLEAVMVRLSVSRSKVYELLASGDLRSVKVGRRRLVSEAQLAQYIARLESRLS